jgi:hypothetical protein
MAPDSSHGLVWRYASVDRPLSDSVNPEVITKESVSMKTEELDKTIESTTTSDTGNKGENPNIIDNAKAPDSINSDVTT